MSLFLHASDSNSRIANIHLVASYTGPMVNSTSQELLDNIDLRRWLLENAPGGKTRTGVHLYNQRNNVHTNIRTLGIWFEHGHYPHNPQGNLTYTNCTGFDIGAQFIQVVSRDPEACDPLGYLNVGTHAVIGCTAEKCGQPRGYGRASFALSFFGHQLGGGTTPRGPWGCPVLIKDTRIRHVAEGYELRGALLCEWRPKLEVYGGETYYDGTSDRDLHHIHMTDEVIYDGHSFHGQRPVDIDGATKIDFTNCTGSVALRVDGVNVGPVSQDFHWTK